MKRIAIRKLNRTQLKKEATKEIYITGRILLDFFGYESIDNLATSRKDLSSKKKFYVKNEYFNSNTPTAFMLSVTRENNEVRLTGFSEILPYDVKETDYVVLEAFDTDAGDVVYLFDVVKSPDIMVLQKLSPSDDEANYDKSHNAKGVIQFSLKPEAKEKYENAYWLWDDNCSQSIYEKIIDNPIEAFFTIKGVVEQKLIRIKPINDTFLKLLRAISNSNNAVETQEKALFYIEEQVQGEWKKMTDIKPSWLEVTYMQSHVVISDRDNNSFVYYGGE